MEIFIGIIILGAILVTTISTMSEEKSQNRTTKELDIDPNDPNAELNARYHKKIQEADTNRLKDLTSERENRERKKEREKERIKQEKEMIKSFKQSTPKVSINPIKWAKYTLIITSAEKKFVDIYNFQTPQEYKKINLVTSLANTVLFEEVRLKRLSPNDFEELLAGLGGDTNFYKLIKPNGNDFFDFEAYKTMYSMYINYRAKELRPIVSMMAVFSSIDGTPLTKDEIEKLTKEYEDNPMFGRSV